MSIFRAAAADTNHLVLQIYDGPDRTAPLIGHYCGDNKPPRFVTTSNTAFIQFHSDMSYGLTGFTLNYEVGKQCLELSSEVKFRQKTTTLFSRRREWK